MCPDCHSWVTVPPLSSLFLPLFASSHRLSRYFVLISIGSEIIFQIFTHSSLSSLFHFLQSHTLSRLYFLPSFYPFPPLFLPSFIPLRRRPPLSRSVRYCLKSWAAVWWLKRWQIDTFTHDRTLADRAQGKRGSDEGRESASEGEGQ